MSSAEDIKAAAAARRAKILAREKDRLQAAKGEKAFESMPSTPTDEGADSPGPSKERPLAARRNKLEAIKLEKEREEEETVPKVDSSGMKVPAPDPPDIMPSDLEPKKTLVIQSKSIDDINAEVAKNTAKFDEGVLAAPKKTKDKELTTVPVKVPHAMSTSSFMSLFRLVLICVLGSFIGYKSGVSEESMTELLNYNAMKTLDPLHSKLAKPLLSDDSVKDKVAETSGWFSGNMLEMAIFGIITIWLLSSMAKAPLEKIIGTKAPKSSGIIGLLLSIYNEGFKGIFESIFSSFAEMILYIVVIIGSGSLASHYNLGSLPQVVNSEL